MYVMWFIFALLPHAVAQNVTSRGQCVLQNGTQPRTDDRRRISGFKTKQACWDFCTDEEGRVGCEWQDTSYKACIVHRGEVTHGNGDANAECLIMEGNPAASVPPSTVTAGPAFPQGTNGSGTATILIVVLVAVTCVCICCLVLVVYGILWMKKYNSKGPRASALSGNGDLLRRDIEAAYPEVNGGNLGFRRPDGASTQRRVQSEYVARRQQDNDTEVPPPPARVYRKGKSMRDPRRASGLVKYALTHFKSTDSIHHLAKKPLDK